MDMLTSKMDMMEVRDKTMEGHKADSNTDCNMAAT
jgi:hypothetical protein